MAIRDDITADDDLYTGEDKSLVFTLYQSDGTTPQNITGWALAYAWKKALSDPDSAAVLTKTTGSGITLTTPVAGICTITIADTDTDALAARTYVHELKRTDAGSETVLTTGTVVLQQAVHRA
jgi:hypothetical protein